MIKNLFKKRYSIVAINENGNRVTYENLFSTKKQARSFCKFLAKRDDWESVTILDTKAKYYRIFLKYLTIFVAVLIFAIAFVSLLFIASFSQ